MGHTYTPKPINLNEIELPEELSVLIEQMAENIHDVWAESRIKEGWRYGPERNDSLKRHPCLVPYHDLDEVEKAYDRNTAIITLKLICQFGFKIVK